MGERAGAPLALRECERSTPFCSIGNRSTIRRTAPDDPAAAAALVAVGDLPKPEELNTSELAAWTALGNVLLNLNETITN